MDNNFFKHSVIGGLSGIVSRLCTAPMELYKVQRQNPFIPYTSIHEVIKKEGILGLWKGNLTNCIRLYPQYSLNYAFFRLAKSKLTSLPDTRLENLLCGAFGGIVAMTSIYPLETIRSRLMLQTSKSTYTGLVDAARKMSFREYYRGLGMTLIGYIPFNALNFMFYEYYKEKVDSKCPSFLIGGMAGFSSVSFTYPTDLIRRRLQLQGFHESVPKYKGILDCFQKIIRQDGVRGLYRGLGACYLKIFPTIGIQFLVIEHLKRHMI